MNWFQRHLNWTLVLVWTVFNLFVLVYLPEAKAGFILDLFREGGAGIVQLYTLFGFAFVTAYLFVCWWVLKRKGEVCFGCRYLLFPLRLFFKWPISAKIQIGESTKTNPKII